MIHARLPKSLADGVRMRHIMRAMGENKGVFNQYELLMRNMSGGGRNNQESQSGGGRGRSSLSLVVGITVAVATALEASDVAVETTMGRLTTQIIINQTN
jgi:hypothetical protein